MAVTMTGQQWKAFYADTNYWPEGRYHDDQIFLLNGQQSNLPASDHESLSDTDTITVVQGDVMGKGVVYVADLELYAQEWLDKLTKTQMVIQCPDDKVEAMVQAVLEAGGEVNRRTKSMPPLESRVVRYEGEVPESLSRHAQSLQGKDSEG